MACNSVAVSKAQVSKIAMDLATLKGVIAKLAGVDAAQVGGWESGAYVSAYVDAGQFTYNVWQSTEAGQTTVEFTVSANYSTTLKSEVEQEQARVLPEFERLMTVGQQGAILKRLAQLGKLSNIQQKQSGVTAKIELTL